MGRIVVGVDGSDDSLRALRFAAEEAKLRGSTLHIVHSWMFPTVTLESDGLPHADLERAAEKVVDDAVASLGAEPSIEIQREIGNEMPAPALIRASEGAEMLVVGSRGRGGVAGLVLGSTSQHLAHHSRCPVVIVPHAERD